MPFPNSGHYSGVPLYIYIYIHVHVQYMYDCIDVYTVDQEFFIQKKFCLLNFGRVLVSSQERTKHTLFNIESFHFFFYCVHVRSGLLLWVLIFVKTVPKSSE